MDCKKLTTWIALLTLSMAGPTFAAAPLGTLPEDATAASVYAYFRIADDDDETSLSPDLFTAQIDEITAAENGYTILPLEEIFRRQQARRALPRRTIALTFDQLDASFLKTTAPKLIEKKIAFTIFVSPGQIDTGKDGSPSWADLRELASSPLVTLGLTAYDYAHTSLWNSEKLTADMNRAKARYREEMGKDAKIFAYPYGEYSPEYTALVARQGFTAAYGQQSGATAAGLDVFTLPRFTMTSEFGDLDRFRMTSQALPFPITEVEPDSPVLKTNPPFPGFTAPASFSTQDLKSMTCFASGMGKVPVQVLGHNRVELRPEQGFDDGRGRINCTLPVTSAEDPRDVRWRWLGFLFSIPVNIREAAAPSDQDFPSPEQP
jgi:peptidoglycan/xylan/chitin deacetylase (PgdA/CDA1 family)